MINETKYVAFLLAISAAFAVQAQQIAGDDEGSPMDQVVPVADAEPDAAEPGSEAEDELTLDEQLAIEFERYRRLVNEGAMDEADVSAKRIVEMVIKTHGPESLEASKALNNLALVQHRNGQYDAAIQNFESAVEIIELREDRLNQRLVNPLKGLGAAQLGSGRPDLASQTFNRAAHITHVNEGPHNIEQVEILESLAQSTLLLGNSKGARDIIDRIHSLNVRHFDGDELALIPSLMRRARWQHAAQYYNDERATYRRAIRIVEKKLGKDDPQLILPLSKLGESFYFMDMTQSIPQQQGLASTGEMYFKRAVKIAEASPEVGWRGLVDTKLALADYYVYGEANNRARKIYENLWEFLSTDEERLAARDALLEQPVLLREGALPKYIGKARTGDAAGGEFLTGTIRVDYTVSKRGRVRNIRTEAKPPQFTDMQRMVHREIRQRVFRPLMRDGRLQTSDNFVFEHSFFYQQADLDKAISMQEQAAKQR
ncbi:MAG: tetratricopeptide repeat protein [Gammaproteobacteria bacterium]|nr:tetratricopeptide repeat protein [Gammaproteobacteria bacterium]